MTTFSGRDTCVGNSHASSGDTDDSNTEDEDSSTTSNSSDGPDAEIVCSATFSSINGNDQHSFPQVNPDAEHSQHYTDFVEENDENTRDGIDDIDEEPNEQPIVNFIRAIYPVSGME